MLKEGPYLLIERMKRKSQSPQCPRNRDEWRASIENGIGLAPEEGETLRCSDDFPFDRLVDWIRQQFSEDDGYSPDFVPALIRNIKGLVSWVYGDSSEPFWPGHDEDD